MVTELGADGGDKVKMGGLLMYLEAELTDLEDGMDVV